MNTRRQGLVAALGYSPREMDLAMRAVQGLTTGRVPVMSFEDWEIAERVADQLDRLEEQEARRA